MPSAAEIKDYEDKCKARTTCVNEWHAANTCAFAQLVCGADNKTDVIESAKRLDANCRSVFDALTMCTRDN